MKKKAFLPNWFIFDGWLTRLVANTERETTCIRCGSIIYRSIKINNPICYDCKAKKNNELALIRNHRIALETKLNPIHIKPLGPEEPDMV